MSGPFINEYGDVISSALGIEDADGFNLNLWGNFQLCVGQVMKIYDIKDPKHPHAIGGMKPYCTVYDVVVLNSDKSTNLLSACVLAQPTFGGGINNFFEVIQTDPKFDKLGTAEVQSRELLQSHYVIVGFVGGNMDSPVILGSMPHPNNIPMKVREKFKKDKSHVEGEIQGLNFKIDKDGAFTLTYHGPRNDDPLAKGDKAGQILSQNFRGEKEERETKLEEKNQDKFPGEDAPTVINIDKDGNVTLTNNAKQRIKVDRLKKTIRIDNAETYINMEQGEKGDAKVQIVANNVEIGHKDKSTTPSMNGSKELQPMLCGDDWQQFMKELIDEIMKIYVPTGTGPSGTPVNKPQFRALQKRLKDVLSKKHKVEK